MKLGGEHLDRAHDLGVELLKIAWRSHAPAVVTKVALDLAGDVRLGKGGQADSAIKVEAVDRLEQAERSDLHEVIGVEAAIGVALGDSAHPRQHHLDELVAGVLVTVLAVASQQRELLFGTNGWVWFLLSQLHATHMHGSLSITL